MSIGFIACAIHRMPRAFSGALRHCKSSQLLLQQRRNRKRRGVSPSEKSCLISPVTDPKCPPELETSSIPNKSPPLSPPPLLPKNPSHSLLCELTDPKQPLFYKTSFGIQSLSVPECLDCRAIVSRSYAAHLPDHVYDLIVGQSQSKGSHEMKIAEKNDVENEAKCESNDPGIFTKIYGYISRTVNSCSCQQLVAQSLKLLVSSAVLQVSVVQSLTST